MEGFAREVVGSTRQGGSPNAGTLHSVDEAGKSVPSWRMTPGHGVSPGGAVRRVLERNTGKPLAAN
jgi:hypothetical protein